MLFKSRHIAKYGPVVFEEGHTPFYRFIDVRTTLMDKLAEMQQYGFGKIGCLSDIGINAGIFVGHDQEYFILLIYYFCAITFSRMLLFLYFFPFPFFIRVFSSSTPKANAIEK